MTPNIYLIGPMGVGKTTIGRQLAAHLGLTFKDSDQEIVNRTGVTIPTIFDIEGEEGFRKRESDMLAQLCHERGVVVATGGGAILREENRTLLGETGWVVYLNASIDQLVRRTARDKNRPLLQTEDPRAKLVALMEQREPIYRAVADIAVCTENRSIGNVIKEIEASLPQQ